MVGRSVVLFETVIGDNGRMSSNAAALAVTQTSLFHNTPHYQTSNVNKCKCIWFWGNVITGTNFTMVRRPEKFLISSVKSIDSRRLQLLAVSLIQRVIYWSVVDDITNTHNLKRLLYSISVVFLIKSPIFKKQVYKIFQYYSWHSF
jgi:hypothetical protein